MILCFIIYQYTNSVFLKFILSFVLKHFLPRTIWNRSKRKPLPVSYAHSCSSCKFFPYPDIFSLKWFVCVFFFSSSPLIQNKFGVKHWLGPLSEAAEGGWNSVSPSSGFCSKCTSLFDVTQLLGRLLSLFHHCGYSVGYATSGSPCVDSAPVPSFLAILLWDSLLLFLVVIMGSVSPSFPLSLSVLLFTPQIRRDFACAGLRLPANWWLKELVGSKETKMLGIY